MKYFIINTILIIAVMAKPDKGILDSSLRGANTEKRQEKRGIGYNTPPGYTNDLEIGGDLGYNNGIGYTGLSGFVGGNGYSGYYNPYTPPRVAALGAISGYNNPAYYNGAYNTGYNGYSNGYPVGYGTSKLRYPYNRQGYYNSYPSSYFNSILGGSVVGGGLGLGERPSPAPVIANGYQYGPGISGSIY